MKSLLLARLGFILLILPVAATAQQFGDLTYTSDGVAITITGYTGPGGAAAIPSTIDGLPVARIGDNAFSYSGLTNVMIPDSVAVIGNSAFWKCTSLVNLTVPASVTFLSNQAFENCTGLKGVFFKGNAPSFLGGWLGDRCAAT